MSEMEMKTEVETEELSDEALDRATEGARMSCLCSVERMAPPMKLFEDGVAAYGKGDYAQVSWYRKAADQGYADAQSNLGRMYAKGLGVPQDYVQAHMWFNLAAAKGDADAIKNRDRVSTMMTPAQIAEAQKLAREWKPKEPEPEPEPER
jgi:hypothetical protein